MASMDIMDDSLHARSFDLVITWVTAQSLGWAEGRGGVAWRRREEAQEKRGAVP
jgi:hypothetical protein